MLAEKRAGLNQTREAAFKADAKQVRSCMDNLAGGKAGVFGWPAGCLLQVAHRVYSNASLLLNSTGPSMSLGTDPALSCLPSLPPVVLAQFQGMKTFEKVEEDVGLGLSKNVKVRNQSCCLKKVGSV